MTSPAEQEPAAADDLRFVRRLLAGEPGTVDEFVARMGCVRRILTAKNTQLGQPLDVEALEDLIQDTLIGVWRKLPGYEGRGALEGWVYRFAYFELLARIRSQRREPRLLDDVAAGPEPVAPQTSRVDQAEQVYRMLEQLGPPDNDVLRLKHLEGLTFEEIAARTATSINTVKSRYYRGLEKLRGQLGLAGNEPAAREESA